MSISSTLSGLFSRSISIEIAAVAVIATVVGVYAAPIYSDYLIRAKVLEALRWAEPMKHEVHSFVNLEGRLPDPSEHKNTDTFVDNPTNGILSIGLFGSGKIGIVTDDLGGDSEYGQQIWLVPELTTNSLRWRCRQGTEQSPFPNKYLPTGCS